MLMELHVARNDAGQRVERYLRKYLPLVGLDRLHSLFRRKEIKVGGKPVKRSHSLQAGDMIRVYGLKEEEAERSAGSGPAGRNPASATGEAPFDIPILHEDAHLLVLDKPAGMAVHPGTGIRPGASVIEKVRARPAAAREWGELFQPSLVHRLDKDTSGVLLVALSGESLRGLTAALREGRFRKRYSALVEGVLHPRQGTLSGGLLRVDGRAGGAKAEVSEEEGKSAVTHYRTVKDFGKFSLLSVIIETGRMHQIRAHFAHAGHPLAGDSRYGSHERNREYRRTLGLNRIFLHASELEADLGAGKKLSFRSPLPPDLAPVLERLAPP